VRLKAFLHRGLEDLQQRDALAPAEALVGERRVGEAVAQHDVAALERRRDHPRDVVAPRGEHEQRFAHAVHRAVQHELAQLLCEIGAAGLAGAHDAAAGGAQRLGGRRDVRRLAGAVDAFEGDESSAHSITCALRAPG
jgi:hypothetical protein